MNLTELWREPRVLTVVGLCTVVVSITNAVSAFKKGMPWEGVFWSACGFLFILYSFDIYYWNIGRGARRSKEREQQRREELDRFYTRLKE